jgi:hypothetical protein
VGWEVKERETMTQDDDIRAMLATSDDIFSDGASQSPCFLVNYDDEIQMDNFGGGKQFVRRTGAQICTADFPNLQEDDKVVVNDTAYKVLDTRLIHDGRMTLVQLQIAQGIRVPHRRDDPLTLHVEGVVVSLDRDLDFEREMPRHEHGAAGIPDGLGLLDMPVDLDERQNGFIRRGLPAFPDGRTIGSRVREDFHNRVDDLLRNGCVGH